MSRRMIDPQTIIKSQIVDDKEQVDLNEILEKYGTQGDYGKSVTLQFYSKESLDDGQLEISCDGVPKGYVIQNGAITITKADHDDNVYITGLILDNAMGLVNYITINSGDYEDGIIVQSDYYFDVHVIKV